MKTTAGNPESVIPAPKKGTADTSLIRRRLVVRGRVQGVGFRPFVYRLATRLGLAGEVGNDSHGAWIEIEGPPEAVEAFLAALPAELPPVACLSGLSVEPVAARGDRTFAIRPSACGESQDAEITPDVAVCDACLAELFDPADRRYRYPFINCMHCGPRYSIVRAVPYDRANTTMARFVMCPACRAEYDDPLNRRFHAQPNACPACGPRLWLATPAGEPIAPPSEPPEAQAIAPDPVTLAGRWLRAGRILAVKGIGGFHLACRADDEEAVKRLRSRKHREAKALALMVPSLETARELAELDPVSEAALCSPIRPIVLAPKRDRARIAPSVAPASDDYGLMLPYAPLHHLLFAEGLPPLVMTSANPSDEPLCRDNDEALRRLAGIADAFLLHDRDIERRVDDSVVMACTSGRVASAGGRVESEDRGHLLPPGSQRDVPLVLARSHEGTAVDDVLPIRRARGYAPAPIEVAIEASEPILALGGELKSTICLLAGRQAVLSEHLGELSNPATYRNFVQTITCFQDLLRLEPRVLACDLHPDYVATRHARRQGLPVVEVQHHHAHVASCLADNGLSGRVLGVACDGTGYGTDGAIWGCEILDCDEAGFTRAAHLVYFPLPGGDSAAQDTWRPAVALLHQAFGSDWRRAAGFCARRIEPRALAVTAERLAGPARFPMTSSLGRLFDAVAFLLGVCDRNRYEAEAAMTLEALARRCPPEQALPYVLRDDGGPLRLDVAPMLRALVERIRAGDRTDRLARAFHDTLSALLAEAVLRAAERTGLNRVVLSGGCFANRLLLEGIAEPLRRAGLAVFAHRRVPTGDGGLALGQAVVAAARLIRS